jgi:hypothetical protein
MKSKVLSPEMRLLLACGRSRLDTRQQQIIIERCQGILDWKRFLDLAGEHSVLPLIWHCLRAVGVTVLPPEVGDELHRRAEENARWALQVTAELIRLAQLLKSAGIRMLPLKGTVLALQIHGNLGLRAAGDLDVFVDPARFWDTERLLLENGYERVYPSFELSPAQTRSHLATDHHSVYQRRGSDVQIEIHWQWTNNPLLFPFSFDDAWRKQLPVKVGGISVAGLPAEELLLYLCIHGAVSEWSRLKWLCDIPELLAAHPELDMQRVVMLARQLGVSRMLAQGFLLANELLDTPVPEPVAELAQQDTAVARLVRLAHQALLEDKPYWYAIGFRQLAHVFYELGLRPELRYKWRSLYCISLRTKDYAVIRLPDGLFPLYFLLRPFIWGIRQLQKHRESLRA